MATIGSLTGDGDSGPEEAWDIMETQHLIHHLGSNSQNAWNFDDNNTENESEEPPTGEMYNDYLVIKVLGKGSFGIVKKCQRVVNDPPYREFALKVMSKSRLRKVKETVKDEDGFPMRIDGLQKLQNEINLMRHLFHRNVSILFEVINDPNEDSVILVTEYMTGGAVMNFNSSIQCYEYSIFSASILQGVGKRFNAHHSEEIESTVRPITESEAVSLFCDLLKGLEYLHSKGIAHRDIKPENLLLHHSGSLRISDFGSAQSFDLSVNPEGLVSNTVGTIAFWPPESLVTSATTAEELDDFGEDDALVEFSSFSADLWAAGCTLHCFLYNKLPFSITDCTVTDLISRISDFGSFISITGLDFASLSAHTAEWVPHCDYQQYPDEVNLVWKRLLQNTKEERSTLRCLFEESSWVQREIERRERGEEAEGKGRE